MVFYTLLLGAAMLFIAYEGWQQLTQDVGSVEQGGGGGGCGGGGGPPREWKAGGKELFDRIKANDSTLT